MCRFERRVEGERPLGEKEEKRSIIERFMQKGRLP